MNEPLNPSSLTAEWAAIAPDERRDMEPAQEGDPAHFAWMRWVDKVASIILHVSMYVWYPLILIVILVDVIGRNFFASPLSWAIEGSGLFLIGGIFLAVPRVELDRNHILLDILYARYSYKTQLACDMLTRAVGCLWMLAATIRSSVEIHTSFLLDESGTDFRAPFWPIRVIMTFGFLMLALTLLHSTIDSYRKFRREGK
ncbi:MULTISPECIES: TRAP transporter small permease subunit [unclassified Desulfovibrio]|uniref:TRAP transporter small permease subunit n=1 Tax=unclassified Desulfovibrio TaxID=2593640 RepID=UPI000F5DF2E0|nr:MULTISPECIES: TRAP transporter small permease [unclassified Desulfovibrio]RRD71894.1 TRAP transporter small permease [Desulfovibrio sp. OH1209_COT-279]RRD88107.1 TRAP transporter small permease [Desulfovibrio sp. OH1186_COT-070]